MVNRQTNRAGTSTQARRPGFTYKFRTEQTVKDRTERKGGGRFDSPFKATADLWRPKGGENQIRILPPTWDNHDHFGYEIWVHSFVGSENGTYLCPSKMNGTRCPICSLATQAKNNDDQEDWQQLKVKQNYVYWIIDRDSENQHPQLYLLGWKLDQMITALTYQKRSTSNKVLFIDHPDQGYDIIIRRSGEKLNTTYLPSIVPESCPIFDDQQRQDEVMQYIVDHPISDMLHFYELSYLERVMSGNQEAPDDLDEPAAEVAAATDEVAAQEGEEGYYDGTAAEGEEAPWEGEPEAQPAPQPAARPAPRTAAAPQRQAQTRAPAPAPTSRPAAPAPRQRAAPPQEEVVEEEVITEETYEQPVEEIVEEAAPAPAARPAPRPPAQRPTPAAAQQPRPAAAPARPAPVARPAAAPATQPRPAARPAPATQPRPAAGAPGNGTRPTTR